MKYKISADAFLANHERSIKRATRRLKRHLADPGEKSTHDLRTAVRRLSASHAVLPGRLRRNGRTKRFVTLYKRLFKMSNRVRDLDVMMMRLKRSEPDAAVRELLEQMREERRVCLEEVSRLAAVQERLREPVIPQKEVPAGKLERRFRRLIIPLFGSIEELLPVVVADRGRVKEMHRLRVRCKKLRYLLEIIAGDAPGSALETLRRMQDLLGAVHDCDVMIEFLKGTEQRQALSKVIASETRRRQLAYRKFVSFAAKAPRL